MKMLTGINIFSLHYFLWFAALTPIYSYVSVYAEHYANATASQYGLLNMVMPFVTIGLNVLVCSLADRHQAHRSCLLWLLVAALASYSSYWILPFFASPRAQKDELMLNAWILICVITAVSTIAMSLITCLSDTLASNSSQRSNSSYGQIRVWGTMGWSVGSFILSFINQSSELPLLVPGLLMTSVLIVVDLLAILFWPNKDDFKIDEPSSAKSCHADSLQTPLKDPSCDPNVAMLSSESKKTSTENYCSFVSLGELSKPPATDIASVKIQWMLFKGVAWRRKSIFVYMTLFTLSGVAISLQWSYYSLFLKRIHAADFAFISGLAMAVESILGELPSFILADHVIRVLGKDHTLSLCFISMGARFLLYRYLLPNSSIYFVIIPGILHGPSFGLFYVVMTEVAAEYSNCEVAVSELIRNGIVPDSPGDVEVLRKAMRATMQSIMTSCYEGLGLGVGSIVGGVVIQQFGFGELWFYSALVTLFIGMATSLLSLKQRQDERRYHSCSANLRNELAI